MKLRLAILVPAFLSLLGCDGTLAVHLPEPVESIEPVANDRFDARRTGTAG